MQVYGQDQIEPVAYELKHGRAAVVETDTQLGLVCMRARLIYDLKDRPRRKKLVTFVRSIRDVPDANPLFKDLAARFWPGALTLIAAGKSYRAPDHAALQAVLALTGPLFSSSANVSGRPPLKNAVDALDEPRFASRAADLIVVEGEARSDAPSTVFDTDKRSVLRRGALYAQLTA